MPVPLLVKNGCTKTENQHIFYVSIDVTQFLYMLISLTCTVLYKSQSITDINEFGQNITNVVPR